MSVLLITDELMLQHDPGAGHPERPARLRAILDALERPPTMKFERAKPQAAARAAIERVHRSTYVDVIDSLRGRSAQLDPDTAVSSASVEAAYLAAGAAIDAVNAVCRHEGHAAFALVRPPGHHAEADRAMGFCLFNNIAIAAAHALAEHGVERVLIVDWDVHHGNGTQHAFEKRRDVLFFSSHQARLFPDTGDVDEIGAGDGAGFTVNAPLPPGFDDAGYASLYERLLVPIADHVRPDLVLVSAGFDAHRDDPLGSMRVTEAGFANLCAIVRGIAQRHARGRLALVLEGGYDLPALARSVLACVDILRGGDAPAIGKPDSGSTRVIDELCRFHARGWKI